MPLAITRSTPCLSSWGHQADHTVQWQRGTFPPKIGTGLHKDAFKVWDSAIGSAATSWNGGGFTVCENCGSSNIDGGVITVRTAGPKQCDENSFACVQHLPSSSSSHIGNVDLILEHIGEDHGGYEVVWTNNASLNGKGVPHSVPSAKYYNFKGTAVHEFGHTLGLKHPQGMFDYYPSVMENISSSPSVTEHDRKYLRAIYYGHTPHLLE